MAWSRRPLGCPGRGGPRSKTRSVSGSNARTRPAAATPAGGGSRFRAWRPARSASASSASRSAARWPSRPSITARSVAWPLPVNAREPWRWTRIRSEAPSGGPSRNLSASSSRKAPAAAIGPIVWDEDGPIPTLKMSNTLRNIGYGNVHGGDSTVMPDCCLRPETGPSQYREGEDSLARMRQEAVLSRQKSAASRGSAVNTSGPLSVMRTGSSSLTPSGPSSAPT